jgi:hypothetical protein
MLGSFGGLPPLGFDQGLWGGDVVQQLALEGQDLEDYVQQWVAGVSGMDGAMMRQRWQPEPPNIPDWGVDWGAVGVTRHRPIGIWSYVGHCSDGNGYDQMQRHEDLEILVSFYGPNCDEYASNLHNGVMIWQNRSVLRLVGMAFVELDEAIRAPEMIKNRWWDRVDLPLVLRRIIIRNYAVRNLLSASAAVITDVGYTSPVTVEPPAS